MHSNARGYHLVSADAHVLEPGDLFETRLPAALRDRAPRLTDVEGVGAWVVKDAEPAPLPASVATGSGYRFLDGGARDIARVDEILPALRDPAERLRAQDADSVDAEVLYSFPGLWDAIKEAGDAELERACAQVYNDWIAEFSAHSPDRLVGLGRVPATSVDDAVQEARRCVEQLGLRGVVLDGWPSGATSGGSSEDDSFWSTVNELDVPVSIHYGFGVVAATSPSTGIAPGLKPQMADIPLPMVAAGVFDRYPNLRIVLAHGDAGWAFHWLEFLDINYVRQRHLDTYQLQDPDALPSEYIRRHLWFTFSDDRSAVKNRHKIGAAHLMWSTHFPLDTADWPDDRQHAVQLTDELPTLERDALLATNAARLYKLPGYEDGFPAAELGAFEQLVYF